MPLKYLAGVPVAVKIVGWAHGILFILFCAALWQATRAAGWPLGRAAVLLVAALLPFGPFLADPRLKREAAEILGQSAVGSHVLAVHGHASATSDRRLPEPLLARVQRPGWHAASEDGRRPPLAGTDD